MSAPYLDSAGNVNTAVAADIASFVYASRAAAAAPAQPMVNATAAQVAADNITGMPNVVTDV